MTHGPRSAALPPPSDTSSDNDIMGALQQKSDGARTENGMHLLREYSLLALEDPEGVRANAGTWERGDGHGATGGKV